MDVSAPAVIRDGHWQSGRALGGREDHRVVGTIGAAISSLSQRSNHASRLLENQRGDQIHGWNFIRQQGTIYEWLPKSRVSFASASDIPG